MKNRGIILAFCICGISAIPFVASAIPLEISIGDRTSVNGLADYISVVYQFGIGIIGVLAAVMIMFNGVKWIGAAGNSGRVGEAKQGIVDALIGVTIAMSSYVLLVAINPALIEMNEIVTPGLNISTTSQIQGANAKSSSSKSGATVQKNCTPITTEGNLCSVEALKATCFGANAEQASAHCHKESGGDPTIPSVPDRCEPGGEVVSWGLFQLNLTYFKPSGLDCPKAFSGGPYTSKDHTCEVPKDTEHQTLYNQCVTAATDAEANIAAACAASKNGADWQYWGGDCSF